METTSTFCTKIAFADLQAEGPIRFDLFRRANQLSERGAKKTLALLREFRTLSKTESQLLGVNLSSTVGNLRDSGYVIDTIRSNRQTVYHLRKLEPDPEYAEERAHKHEDRRNILRALMENYCSPVEAVTLVLDTPSGLTHSEFAAHHQDKPEQIVNLLWRAYEKLHAAA
jgi:hypothetical protein